MARGTIICRTLKDAKTKLHVTAMSRLANTRRNRQVAN